MDGCEDSEDPIAQEQDQRRVLLLARLPPGGYGGRRVRKQGLPGDGIGGRVALVERKRLCRGEVKRKQSRGLL